MANLLPWFPVAPTVAERVKRALRARDGLQAAIQGDQNLETAEVALYNLGPTVDHGQVPPAARPSAGVRSEAGM